jgi:hypothetical protein
MWWVKTLWNCPLPTRYLIRPLYNFLCGIVWQPCYLWSFWNRFLLERSTNYAHPNLISLPRWQCRGGQFVGQVSTLKEKEAKHHYLEWLRGWVWARGQRSVSYLLLKVYSALLSFTVFTVYVACFCTTPGNQKVAVVHLICIYVQYFKYGFKAAIFNFFGDLTKFTCVL